MDVLYRYHESAYEGGRLMLSLQEFPITKRTPSGAWIDIYGQKRFVKLTARKRYACETKDEALESFHARKKRQVLILSRQLERAQAALRLQREDELQPFGLL